MTLSFQRFFILLFLGTISCNNSSDIENNDKIANQKEEEKNKNKSLDYNKDFLLGKFDYRDHPNFVLVSEQWSDKEIYLQKETLEAFDKMATAASNDGIPLIILSGTRNFDEQKVIWENKWNLNKLEMQDETKIALKILTSSSMPTSSRHHWGTDIDINSVEEIYFESAIGKQVYNWLKNNASKFGFCQVYDDKKVTKRTGYETEKWHWSYLPLAKDILSEYKMQIELKDIKGFHGDYLAGNKDIQIINNYVLGISKECNF